MLSASPGRSCRRFLRPLHRLIRLLSSEIAAPSVLRPYCGLLQPSTHSIRDIRHTAKQQLQITIMLITRGFSLTNFIIGTSALSFQVFVLFPWHEKLEQEFHQLRTEHAKLLEAQTSEVSAMRKQLEQHVYREKTGRASWLLR